MKAAGTVLAVAMWVLAMACGGPDVVRADVDQRSWLEVTSPHFVIVTDAGEDEARRLATDLETSWMALTAFYNWLTPGRRAPVQRFQLFYLRGRGAFAALIGERRHVGGYVVPAPDLSGERIAVTYRGTPAGNEVVLHELAHLFNRHYLSLAPVWLNEGLATYLQTLEVKDGVVRLGLPPAMDQRAFGSSSWVGIDELLAGDFYAKEGRQHYFAAWKLVHLLANSAPDYNERFRRYLGAVATGEDRERAWSALLADDAEELAATFRSYQMQQELTVWNADLALPPVPPAQERRMRAGEAHGAWIQLLLSALARSADMEPDLLRQLEAADAAAPDWAERDFWAAIIAARSDRLAGQLGDPVTLLRKYLAAHPDDGRAWDALVTIRLERALPDGYLGTEDDIPPAILALEDDVRALVARASSPRQLERLARYYVLAGKPTTAQPLARMALEQFPGCGPCLDTMALIAYRLGAPDQALDLQRRAVTMLGHAPAPAPRARLTVYEKAAGQHGS